MLGGCQNFVGVYLIKYIIYYNIYIIHIILYKYIFELTLIVGSAGPLGPPFHRSVGVKVTE